MNRSDRMQASGISLPGDVLSLPADPSAEMEVSHNSWHPKKQLIETPSGSCIRSGHLLFVGGIDGFDPARHQDPGDISVQARRALSTMKAILEGAGSSMDQVLKVQMSVADPNRHLAALNEVYREFFPDIFPVRSYSGAKTSQMGTDGVLCQLSCMAHVD